MDDGDVSRTGGHDVALALRDLVVGYGVARVSLPFALKVAAGDDLGGSGLEIGGVQIGDDRRQLGYAVALVRPVLMPPLGAFGLT